MTNSSDEKSITTRIESSLGMPGLAETLATKIEPSDLQSLLLEIYRIRSAQKSPSQVLSDFQNNRFVRPSKLAPEDVLGWNKLAFSLLPKPFEVIELSPVCPLGTCSSVAGVTQDWSVTTSRNTEVVSDPTNVMALEASLRRRVLLKQDPKSNETVSLATSHRAVRAQMYNNPLASPHFRLFALCSAGRNQEGYDFGLNALSVHVSFYIAALEAFLGPMPLRLSYSFFGQSASYRAKTENAVTDLRPQLGRVECVFDANRRSGGTYYDGPCFHIDLKHQNEFVNVVDGGAVDWARKLLSNDKERLVISGVGSERLCFIKAHL